MHASHLLEKEMSRGHSYQVIEGWIGRVQDQLLSLCVCKCVHLLAIRVDTFLEMNIYDSDLCLALSTI